MVERKVWKGEAPVTILPFIWVLDLHFKLLFLGYMLLKNKSFILLPIKHSHIY